MASRPSPFGILASTIPTEHCPPLWLIKGSGVIGWLIAPCRLWFFSLMAGWNVRCWHALRTFCRLCLCMLPICKKNTRIAIMALGRRRSGWRRSCAEDAENGVISLVLRSPIWLLCEHWHFNLKSAETSAHLAVRHTEGLMAVQSATALIFIEKKKSPQQFLVFFCCFLDSRKKTKQRRKPLFSNQVSCVQTKQKKGSQRKLGYTIFSHCRRSQQINSTRLQTHSSKATFLSLSPRQAKRSGKIRKERKGDRWRQGEERKKKIKRQKLYQETVIYIYVYMYI